LLWKKIREPRIIKQYHPDNLEKILSEEDGDLDTVLKDW